MGPGSSLTLTVYRMPASGTSSYITTAPTSFVASYTISDTTTTALNYGNASISLAAGDRLSVYAQYNGQQVLRDITAKLLLI
jgi:hypothetical protein